MPNDLDQHFLSGFDIHSRASPIISTLTMAPTEMIQTALAQPTTPPSSPNTSSDPIVTLSNAQQFIDMVKAVVTMEIASTSPTHQPLQQLVTTEHVQQFLDILKSLGTRQETPPPPAAVDKVEFKEPKARGSTLEFKKVTEVYVYVRLTQHIPELMNTAGTRRNTSIKSWNHWHQLMK